MKKITSLILATLLIATLALSLISCSGTENRRLMKIGVYDTKSADGSSAEAVIALIVTDRDEKTVQLCRFDRVSFDTAASATPKLDESGNIVYDDNGGTVYSYTASVTSIRTEGDDSDSAWLAEAGIFAELIEGKTKKQIASITDEEIAALGIDIDPTSLRGAISRAFDCGYSNAIRCGKDVEMGMAITCEQSYGWSGLEVACTVGGVIMENGKAKAAILDTWAPTVGASASPESSELGISSVNLTKSKLDKGDAYDMRKVSGIGCEWYEQAQVYANTVRGKTVSEMAKLPTDNVAGCTIDVTGYLPPLVTAASRAE